VSTAIKRKRGRPRADRTANPELIRQRMAERGIRTIPELGDRVGALLGRAIQDSTLSRIVSGKWRFISLQRAIARTLGLPLDEAFPKIPGMPDPATIDPTSLGGRIRRARLKKGLTLKQLAEEVDRIFASAGHWEAGRARPDSTTLRRIADVLEVNYEWLATGKGRKK